MEAKMPLVKSTLPVILYSVVLVLLAAACNPKQPSPPKVEIGKELNFQVIESAEGQLQQYQKNEPTYFLIRGHDDINQVKDWISGDAVKQLNALDFSKYFAIAVFQGHKPTNQFRTVIEHIGLRGNTLVIIAQFWENGPGMGAGAVVMSPYELVKVEKDSNISLHTKVEFYSYIQYNRPQ